jgi:DNA-binding transcriptional ArsR family regulator
VTQITLASAVTGNGDWQRPDTNVVGMDNIDSLATPQQVLLDTATMHASPPLSHDEALALTDDLRAKRIRWEESKVREVEDRLSLATAAVKAFALRAWLPLGYNDWETYCAQEFSVSRLHSAAEERRDLVLALESQSREALGAPMSDMAMAVVLGVHAQTIHRDLQLLRKAGLAGGAKERIRQIGIDGKCRVIELVTESARKRRADIGRLLAAGLTQVEIALQLGVSQPTVSTHKQALETLGQLTPESRPPDAGEVDDLESGRPAEPEPHLLVMAEILLDAAVEQKAALDALRTLEEVVFDADEWVTDPLFKGDVADIIAESLAAAVARMVRLARALGLDVSVAATGDGVRWWVDDPRVEATVARTAWAAHCSGAAPRTIAAELGRSPDDIEAMLTALRKLPNVRLMPRSIVGQAA